jgi:hypothetical protein
VLSARHGNDHGQPSVGLIRGTQVVSGAHASHQRATQATQSPWDTAPAAAHTLWTRPG